MNIKQIGRVLVCLLLVCCLIVRISPIQAKAATLTGTVAAGTAIAAGLVALGIGVGATEIAFNNLVDSLTAVAGSDRVTVWISETADGFVTYLQESFLGSLLAHCFDDGILTSSGYHTTPPYKLGEMMYSEALSLAQSYQNYIIFHQAGGYDSLYLCTGSLSVGTSYPIYLSTPDGVIYTFSINSNTGGVGKWDTGNKFVNLYTSRDSLEVISGTPGFSTSEDLTLGSVGASMSAPNYDPWRTDAIPVVPPVVGGGTADEEDALPVTFPGLDTPSITGQTQAGAQSGITSGSVVDDILSGSGTVTDGLTGSLSDTKAQTFLDSIFAFFTALFAPVTEFFDNFWAFAEYLIECLEITLADKIEAVTTAVTSIPAVFSSWLEKILEWLAKIWDLISALPGTFVDVITEALVWAFVPSESYLDAEVTALCSEFPLADSCKNLITAFRDSLSGLGGEPPVIYIHLEDYEGSYNIGGTVPILDMRWYARYKPTVDTLLSSLLWIFFIWRVLVHAPSIISGVAGDVEAFNSGPSGGYFSADNPYRGQFERPARGRFESRRNRK